MRFGVHLADSVNDNTLLINDVSSAKRAFCYLAVHFLLAPCLVGLQDGEVGVGDEVEGQFILGDEPLVRGGGIAAHAQYLIAHGDEPLVVVAQVAGLGGAARRAVFGVEVEYELLASEVAQFHSVSILVNALEIGGFYSDLQHSIGIFVEKAKVMFFSNTRIQSGYRIIL